MARLHIIEGFVQSHILEFMCSCALSLEACNYAYDYIGNKEDSIHRFMHHAALADVLHAYGGVPGGAHDRHLR
jgi:hypothetical protein